MPYCDEHKAHKEHFDRNDARIAALEDTTQEIQNLVTRIDVLVANMNKMYWVVVVAVAGSIVAALMALIVK